MPDGWRAYIDTDLDWRLVAHDLRQTTNEEHPMPHTTTKETTRRA
ncbi:hypothetical protein PAI11_35800 [Patulibacter medicamentivorans]|uniref:Uncharacterized protein n=2 Tax=Patulibacter medicamentivorans TaxID=1097667 RepID=H0E9R0_9ACTN|nr:hypothetical protein PAI11_35800 [Patulibacter medicamentivorans]